MSEIAEVKMVEGPSMIRDENGLLSGYVYVDFDTSRIDVGSYVERAKQEVAAAVKLPTGYAMTWSGQYENMLRAKERLKLILPITLVLIFGLLYMNTRSSFKAGMVMLAVPFSAVGAIWLLYLLGYNVSIAVWVGMIALMGLDAETGVFMLLFLDLPHDEAKARGKLRTTGDLVEAIIHGAVKRVRPEGDDGLCRFHRPSTHHVVHGHGRRPDETHRCAHGGRAGHVVRDGIARLPGDLLPVATQRSGRRSHHRHRGHRGKPSEPSVRSGTLSAWHQS